MTAAVEAPPRRAAYRDPTFLGWLAGYWLSLVGDQIYFIAFAYSAAQLGDPLLTSLVSMASSIPRAVLMLFGGALGDRVGLRRLMLISDAFRVLVMAVAALAGLGGTPMWLLVGAALVFGAVDAAYMPAVTALPAQLLPGDQLPAAVAARQLANRGALLLGAPLGGLLVAVGGFPLACGLNAVSFAVSVVILAKIKPRFASGVRDAKPRRNLLAEVGDGLRFVIGQPVLRGVFLVLTTLEFCVTGPVNLAVPLRSVAQGWGAAGQGWMLGSLGVGGAAGALLVIVAKRWTRPVTIGLWVMLVQAVGVVVVGYGPTLPAVCAAMVAIGASGGVAGSLLGGATQSLIPDGMRARVGSIFVLQGMGLVPVSFTLFGLLGTAVGVPAACAVCGVLIAASVAAAFTLPAIRRT
ncbi:MFS transporter [Longispora sp. K20-0274]|uniref:MFS transporter n=1 Tax=Longispora sp. K20-0274 TaxID=3088255 RepID=UPI003999A5DF